MGLRIKASHNGKKVRKIKIFSFIKFKNGALLEFGMVSGKVMVGILLLVAVFGAVYLFSSFLENPINTAGVIDNPDENSQGTDVSINNVIEITSSGFTPQTLTVSKGDTVTWINKDTEKHWPASAVHPTHTVYPGSSIEKCGTSEEKNIFDACHGLAQGESFSFTFNEVGSWGYHDHLVGGVFGKIIVK